MIFWHGYTCTLNALNYDVYDCYCNLPFFSILPLLVYAPTSKLQSCAVPTQTSSTPNLPARLWLNGRTPPSGVIVTTSTSFNLSHSLSFSFVQSFILPLTSIQMIFNHVAQVVATLDTVTIPVQNRPAPIDTPFRASFFSFSCFTHNRQPHVDTKR